MDHPKKFLNLIDPNARKFLFACYDYKKEKPPKQFFGAYGVCQQKIKQLNEEDKYCAYVTINETDGPKRKLENIIRARAIWVEDDEKRPKHRIDWPLEPSIIVESSPGKYHYYWLTSVKNIAEWSQVMQRMVNDYGCDNKARDAARVMRFPGYQHNKDLNNPFTSKLICDSGTRYNWFQIKKAFPPVEVSNPDSKVAQSDYKEEEAVKALLNSENYHGSLTSIAMSLTNKGVSREMQYMTLFGLMNKIPPAKRREEWEARTSEHHLYECIDTAIRKYDEEQDNEQLNVADIYKEELRNENISMRESNVEFPPGRMANLCQEILEMAPYPNKEIALSGAIGLIAGIAGRRYNVLGMGLNIYIAVLADSGIGKANLKDSINLALRAGGGKFNVGATFVGKSRFTGPKAIFDMLMNGLSRICVIEEAGLISESTAGDGSGITRVLLDLFTSSGYGKWAGDEGYSNAKESIPAIHAPSLSMVNVSTPKSFLRALRSKSADVSGEVARLWMMRSIGRKPYLNRDRRKDFSQDTISILGKLITICHKYQLPECDLETDDIVIDEEFFDEADKWVDLENKYLENGDHLRRTLCSRAWAKIIKLAAIVSLYNGKNCIGRDEYEWASRCITEELNSIKDSFNYEASDDITNVVTYVVVPVIVKMLMHGYKGQAAPPKYLADNGVFTKHNIIQALNSNSIIKELDDDPAKPNPRTGIEKILKYMVSSGLLVYLDELKLRKYKSSSKAGYRITSDCKAVINELMKDKQEAKQERKNEIDKV